MPRSFRQCTIARRHRTSTKRWNKQSHLRFSLRTVSSQSKHCVRRPSKCCSRKWATTRSSIKGESMTHREKIARCYQPVHHTHKKAIAIQNDRIGSLVTRVRSIKRTQKRVNMRETRGTKMMRRWQVSPKAKRYHRRSGGTEEPIEEVIDTGVMSISGESITMKVLIEQGIIERLISTPNKKSLSICNTNICDTRDVLQPKIDLFAKAIAEWNSLNISHNNLSDMRISPHATFLISIFNAIRESASIKKLKIVDTIPRKAVDAFKNMLTHNTSLNVLEVHSEQLQAWNSWVCLKKNSTITELNIANTTFTANNNNFKAICGMTALQKLDCSHNRLDSGFSNNYAKHLKKCESLTELNISYNPLGYIVGHKAELRTRNISVLKDMIIAISHSRLRKLKMVGTELSGEKTGQYFESLIGTNTTLQELDMSKQRMAEFSDTCHLDAAFIYPFSKGLQLNQTLTTLNIGHNRIGTEGLIVLCVGIKQHNMLTELNISHNHIYYDGFTRARESLRELLQNNSVLTNLDVSGNCSAGFPIFNDEHLLDFYNENCPTLVYVNLLHNRLSTKQAADIATDYFNSYRDNPKKSICGIKGDTQVVDLRGNHISDGDGVLLGYEIAAQKVDWTELKFQYRKHPFALMKNMSNMDFSNKDLKGIGGAFIVGKWISTFCNNTLSSLDISNSSITGTVEDEEGLDALITAIKGCTMLKCVNILSNNLGYAKANELIQLMNENDSLKTLCGFNDQTYMNLDLSQKGLTMGCAMLVANELQSHNVETLDLSHNRIAGRYVGEALAKALTNNTVLTLLNVSSIYKDVKSKTLENVPVEDFDEIPLTQTREGKTAVYGGYEVKIVKERKLRDGEEVNIQWYERVFSASSASSASQPESKITFGDELAVGLVSNNMLTSLNISDNNLGDDESEKIAKALSKNSVLKNLNIANNEAGEECARILADGIISNGNLMSLDISRNSICVEGTNAMAKALKDNQNMKELNTARNFMCYSLTTDRENNMEGIINMVNTILTMKSLTSLNISDNNIGALVYPPTVGWRQIKTNEAEEAEDAETEELESVFYKLIDHSQSMSTINVQNLCTQCHKYLKQHNTCKECNAPIQKNEPISNPLGALSIAKLLRKSQTLKNLNISKNNLVVDFGYINPRWCNYSDTAVKKEAIKCIGEALGSAIASNTVLDVLDISSNLGSPPDPDLKIQSLIQNTNLDIEFAQLLATGIRANATLKNLIINGGSIYTPTVTLNTTTTEVDYNNKMLGRVGATILGAWISRETPQPQPQPHPSMSQVMVSLNISNNQIGPQGAKGIASRLQFNQTLRELNLANNNLSDENDTSGIIDLANSLENNTTLTSLNISNNNIGTYVNSGGIDALVHAIRINKGLISVNILYNKIGTTYAENFAQVMKSHPTLRSLCGNKGDETELNMNSMRLFVADAILIAPEIAANKALTSLDISNNSLSHDVISSHEMFYDNHYDLGVYILVQAINENTNMTSLNISRNKLYVEGGKTLANALRKNTNIRELNMNSNFLTQSRPQITSERTIKSSVKAIVDDLCTMRMLCLLDIEDLSKHESRQFSIFGGSDIHTRIDQHIRSNRLLPITQDMDKTHTKLDLSNRFLDHKDAKDVAEYLKEHKRLIHFDISNNTLLAAGGKALVSGLEHNTTIQELNIARNQLGMKDVDRNKKGGNTDMSGVIDIANTISTMKALTSLNISSNCIGELVLPDDWTPQTKASGMGPNRIIGYEHKDGCVQKYKPGVPKGTIAIAKAIRKNDNITSLNISNNNLGMCDIMPAAWVYNGSKQNMCYKHLPSNKDFDSAPAGAKSSGVLELAESIQVNRTLTSLNISNNKMLTREVGKSLCDMLSTNSSLIELDVSRNCWSDIRLDSGYKTVSVEQSDGPGFAEELAIGIHKNKTLNTLDISSNNLTRTHIQNIQAGNRNLDIQS